MSRIVTRRLQIAAPWFWLICAVLSGSATAAQAPPWMHAQVSAELPPHEAKTSAVLMYSETILTVSGPGKMKRLDRRAYKILRPEGEHRGVVRIYYGPLEPITALHGWTIPTTGKDYEVKERDSVDTSLPDIDNGELVSDSKARFMRLPAATVGNIVGYEVEQELRSYVLMDAWEIQDTDPVRESHYRLQLPPGWSYTSTWINHAATDSTAGGTGRYEWTISNTPALPIEDNMPPRTGIAQRMIVSLIPPAGVQAGIQNWNDMGLWYQGLLKDRRDASPKIKQRVTELTADAPTQLAKMQALARFVQTDIRYVAVELGIGGWQPHAASEVLEHRFGDCKDKATLLSVMLQEIGVTAYHLVINTERGSVNTNSPAHMGFNHAIDAIAIPDGMESPTFAAVFVHPTLGRLLIFDPTDPYTPLGRLRGALQGNVALLVTPNGGELIETPQSSPASNGVARNAHMSLDEQGNLSGDVREILTGDMASAQRNGLRNTTQETDRIRPVEALASASLSSYSVTNARIVGFNAMNTPFEWKYELTASRYAKPAGDLLLVRPRILGSKGSGLLETGEPRHFPIEFEGPRRDDDTFDITVPMAYEIDELPPAVDIDQDFAAYHSKTEFKNHALHYARSFEIKKVSLPAARADELKHFYRQIADDERNSAVLKRVAH